MTISQSKEVCQCPSFLTQYFQIVISTYVGLDHSLIMIDSAESLDTTTASVLLLLWWYYSYHIIVLFYDAASSLPCPCLIFCCLMSSSAIRRPSSAACHPLPAFVAKFAAQSSQLLSSSLPALVASFAAPPSDSSHRLPPAFHTTTLPPPSLLQPAPHPDHSHCAVRIVCLPPPLLPQPPPLLRSLLSRLPPPALVGPSQRQCDNIAPTVVTVTS